MSFSPSRIVCVANGRTSAAAPRLSVAIPTFRHDPSPLVAALAPMMDGAPVELLVLDDGSGDPELVRALADVMRSVAAPARLYVAERNAGRAAARNQLLRAAAGRHVLLLDADMALAHADFLARWLAVCAEDPAVVFGGFSMPAHMPAGAALHHHLAARQDCRSAAARNRDPARHTATSNLLVRRDVAETHPFDGAFRGWGWEDVEWALRVAHDHRIVHVDIPAIHLGLDSAETLIAKYREGAPNYRRLADTHPDAVRRFPSWRAAQALAQMPAHSTLQPVLSAVARAAHAPVALRRWALVMLRTSLYAEHAA